MWPIVIGVVGCYAAAVLGIHLAWRYARKKSGGREHYVLVAADHEREMEWVLRSIRWYGVRAGVDVRITVVDEGSRDDTMRIADFFAREGDGVSLWPIGRDETDGSRQLWERLPEGCRPGSNETAAHPEGNKSDRGVHWFWLLQPEGTFGVNGPDHHVLIDLRNPGDLEKLP